MSNFRRKSTAVNQNVYLNNRLSTFTNPPIRTGNLYVEQNEHVGNDLDVFGNLRIGGDLTARNYYATNGNFYLDNYLLIPYGTIIQSAAMTIPDGWLDCDGSYKLIMNYPNLFNAIGYTYTYGEEGDGVWFKVPDIQGRVVVGTRNDSNPEVPAMPLAATGGEETHTLTTEEMPSHTHTSNATGGSIGLITSNGQSTTDGSTDTNVLSEPNLSTGPQALTINSTGSGAAHNNMQPFIVLRYLIKY